MLVLWREQGKGGGWRGGGHLCGTSDITGVAMEHGRVFRGVVVGGHSFGGVS